MPRKPSILWIYTSLLIITFPIANIVYFDRLLASGTLPPDGDSVAIPIFGGILITACCTPFVMAITWLCLRHYSSASSLLAWRRDRPIRSFAATLACLIFTGTLIATTVADFSKPMPAYEYILTIYSLFWIPWFLWLRAACIEQMSNS